MTHPTLTLTKTRLGALSSGSLIAPFPTYEDKHGQPHVACGGTAKKADRAADRGDLVIVTKVEQGPSFRSTGSSTVNGRYVYVTLDDGVRYTGSSHQVVWVVEPKPVDDVEPEVVEAPATRPWAVEVERKYAPASTLAAEIDAFIEGVDGSTLMEVDRLAVQVHDYVARIANEAAALAERLRSPEPGEAWTALLSIEDSAGSSGPIGSQWDRAVRDAARLVSRVHAMR
jgi:hypothetical protein